jgi:hypothetical protein
MFLIKKLIFTFAIINTLLYCFTAFALDDVVCDNKTSSQIYGHWTIEQTKINVYVYRSKKSQKDIVVFTDEKGKSVVMDALVSENDLIFNYKNKNELLIKATYSSKNDAILSLHFLSGEIKKTYIWRKSCMNLTNGI